MTRIAFISTGLGLGGAEKMLLKLVPGLRALSFDPCVVSLRDVGPIGQQLRSQDVPVLAVDLPSVRSPIAMTMVVRRLRAWRPQVVQGWMYHGNVAAWASLPWLACRPPLVFGVRQSLFSLEHERPNTRLAIRWGARVSHRADAIVYNSSTARRQHEEIGYAAKRAIVLPNGFDTEEFVPDENARIAVRRELGFDDNAPLVGLIARWHPMKDHATFLRAAAHVAAEVPSVRFLMAGTDVTANNPGLRALVDETGTGARVALLGPREDIPRLNAALDVACLSSAYGDAFPNVLGEAMSCAVPCVSTDVGDTADILGDTGVIVARGNDGEFAAAVLRLLREGPDARSNRGVAARTRVIERYSLKSVTTRYADLFRSLIVCV